MYWLCGVGCVLVVWGGVCIGCVRWGVYWLCEVGCVLVV